MTAKRSFVLSILAVCLQASIAFSQPYPPTPPGYPQPQPGYPQQPQPGYPQPPQSGYPQQPQTQSFPQAAFPQQSGYPGRGTQPIQLPHAGQLPNAPRSNAYANLPAVTIREFRSSVAEINARGATDMFMTALIKTRKFRVLERARMSEGIAQEKALNQQGMTTGDVGQSRYVGAGYMFEATISEASAATESTSFGISIGGLGAGRTTTKDTIGIDVRVIDIESGVVLDAIDVRKDILGAETHAGGVTTAVASALTRGEGNALTAALAPSDDMRNTRKDSVDNALRAAIEEAVNEIAKRFGADLAQQTAPQPAAPQPLRSQ